MNNKDRKAELFNDINWMYNLKDKTFSILYHRTKELKSSTAASINLIHSEIETTPPHETLEKGKINFELHLIQKMWIPIIPGCKTENPYIIIPEALIDYISTAIKSNVISLDPPPLIIPGHERPVYVTFEKENDSLIRGTIEPIRDDNYKNVQIVEAVPVRNAQNDFRIFVEYLLNNPNFYESTIKDFHLKWKPLIDQKGKVPKSNAV